MSKISITKKITITAMFIALSYALTYLFHYLKLAPFPSVPFLTYDPKDILICISGFILGPWIAAGISVGVSFIEMITISETGFYGLIMNIVSTCAFVIPASVVYKSKKSFIGALLSLLIGYVSSVSVMALWNIIITPIYMSMDRQLLIEKFLLPIILFNAMKTGINVAAILLFYKAIISALIATKLIQTGKQKWDIKQTLIMVGLGLFILITLIIIWILIN